MLSRESLSAVHYSFQAKEEYVQSSYIIHDHQHFISSSKLISAFPAAKPRALCRSASLKETKSRSEVRHKALPRSVCPRASVTSTAT
mmetsp:Transcript_30054/g.44165  ORF Transcript_30054/g.44165 Transcript_30054/m.44165 type:complete len:87 (-) Transcript_30054:442-702(-)